MRLLLLGSAALMLSGCSFLGLGGAKKNIPNVSNIGAISQAGSFGQASTIGQAGTYGQAETYNQAATYGQARTVAQAGTYSQPTHYGQQRAVQSQPVSRCHTGNCLARWNLEGGIGPVFSARKNIVTSGRTNNVAGTDFNSLSFGDAYETGVRGELGGSYALAPNTKVSLLGHYERFDSDGSQNLGTINGDQLTGALSDYEAYGVEVGLRQYATPWKAPLVDSVRPYVEGRLGVSRVSSIDLENTQLAGAPFGGGDIPFYESSWVPTAAGLIGIETPIAKYTTLGVETGIRYQGGLESDTSVLGAGSTLGGLNNNNGRLTVPLTLRGRYRF